MMGDKRYRYLDYARGLAMIFVMYGHFFTTSTSPLRIWLFSFHVPVFFIITGILIYKRNGKLDVKKMLKSILIPYLIFCTINIIGLSVLDLINSNGKWLANTLLNVKRTITLYGIKANWFLPCLFIATIIFYFIKNNVKDKRKIFLIVAIMFLIPFFKVNVTQLYTYKIIMRSFIATGFIFSGYYLGIYIDKINIKIYKLIILLIASLLYSKILGAVSLVEVQLIDPIAYYIGAIAGSLLVILLLKYLDDKNIKFRLLEFIGKNSLIFLGTHMIIGYYIKKVFSVILKTKAIVPNLYLNGLIVLVIATIIEILAIIIYKRIRLRFNKKVIDNENK